MFWRYSLACDKELRTGYSIIMLVLSEMRVMDATVSLLLNLKLLPASRANLFF